MVVLQMDKIRYNGQTTERERERERERFQEVLKTNDFLFVHALDL